MKRRSSEGLADQVKESDSSKILKDSSKLDTTSSGDAETLQHSNPISEEEHIDDYISPHGEKMSFFANRDTSIWVRLDRNPEKTIPLCEPKLYLNRDPDTLRLKFREYLTDKNLCPEYCRLDEQVRFFPVHPTDKCWNLEDHSLLIPKSDTMHVVYHSNGCISYVNGENQVITWDWRDGRSQERSIPASLSTISALAEQNDTLIVGCEDGQVFVITEENASLILDRENEKIYASKSVLIWPRKSYIVEIVATGSSYFAVRYGDKWVNLIKSENGEISSFCDQISGIWSVCDRFLVALRGKNVLFFYDVDNRKETSHTKIFSSELERNNIVVVSDTVHVVTNEEIFIWKRSTSWITLKKNYFSIMWQSHDGVICIKDCSNYKCRDAYKETFLNAETSWGNLVSSIKTKNFILLPSNAYVFPQYSYLFYERYITYCPIFRAQNERPKALHVNGNWFITSMSLLSDGSLMYATDTRGSGIHVITTKGERVFSKYEELTKECQILSFKELAGRSVATLSSDNYIRVITPRFVPLKNSIQVTELRSKLISDPNNLDLFEELAEKFLSRESSNGSYHHAYHTYLDGLEAAVRVKNLHRARRFYEKVKNIFPDRDEPMRLFLSYLTQFPNNKIERTIHLDLVEALKKKNCKRRLFVGEGDFSFTEALIKKHICDCKQLPLAIIATELQENLVANAEIQQRINLLKELGVGIMFNVDAQKIYEEFKNERFERIHWNNPYRFGDNCTRESFREVILKFFSSCEKVQSVGDRIHLSLVKGEESVDWHDDKQYENPIVEGSMKSEYRLVRKRRFGKQRYPGYQHRSFRNDILNYPLREFIFEKVSTSVFSEEVINEKIKNSKPMQNDHKKYYIKVNNKNGSSSEIKPGECYFECSTDDDSSDYYSD